MQFPDYSRCGVNIMASVLRYFGTDNGHSGLPELDAILSRRKYRNVVLMLFDGLSMNALETHLSKDSFVRRKVAAVLSAVFPSTTTAATTSIQSGLEPGNHGWIGWTLHFEKLGKSIDIFMNRLQFSREMAGQQSVVMAQFPYTPVTEMITSSKKASGRCVSPFDDVIVNNIDDLFIQTSRLMREAGRHYIYAYWPEPDHLMHDKGCRHETVTRVIADIDRRLEAFLSQLEPDDLVLVTADHGLVDGIPEFFEDHPALEAMLRIPPCVEPRAASLYVKEEHIEAFPQAFKAAFGDHYLLMNQKQALESGLFGKGPMRAELPSLIGDFFAVSAGPYALYQKREHCRLIGMHGGLTEAEMNVPLIVLRSDKGEELYSL